MKNILFLLGITTLVLFAGACKTTTTDRALDNPVMRHVEVSTKALTASVSLPVGEVLVIDFSFPGKNGALLGAPQYDSSIFKFVGQRKVIRSHYGEQYQHVETHVLSFQAIAPGTSRIIIPTIPQGTIQQQIATIDARVNAR